MGLYSPWEALAPQTSGRGFYTMRDVINPRSHRFRPWFVEVVDVWEDF